MDSSQEHNVLLFNSKVKSIKSCEESLEVKRKYSQVELWIDKVFPARD